MDKEGKGGGRGWALVGRRLMEVGGRGGGREEGTKEKR